MIMTVLYNKKNKKELIKKLEQEKFERITLSFYRYTNIINVDNLRNILYKDWDMMGVLGRVYISKEGINSQISIPDKNIKSFTKYLDSYDEFRDMDLKFAIDLENFENLEFFVLYSPARDSLITVLVGFECCASC